MNTIINRIIALSGPMPDEEGHRRYLRTLPGRLLYERLAALEADQDRPATPNRWFDTGANRNRLEVVCG